MTDLIKDSDECQGDLILDKPLELTKPLYCKTLTFLNDTVYIWANGFRIYIGTYKEEPEDGIKHKDKIKTN